MIYFKTTHYEQWFHYIHIFVNLLWNLTLQPFSICHNVFHNWWISSRFKYLQSTGGVHPLWSQLNTIHRMWSEKHHVHRFIRMQHYTRRGKGWQWRVDGVGGWTVSAQPGNKHHKQENGGQAAGSLAHTAPEECVLCTVYIVHCVIQCALYNVYCTTVQHTLYTVCTLQC